MIRQLKRPLRPLARRYSRVVATQEFNPRWWGALVNPFFITRKGLYREIALCARAMRSGRLLDIGCGTKPYRSLFDVDAYWGIEIWKANTPLPRSCDAIYDGSRLPFRGASFDHVLLTEVLEHVFEPHFLLKEIQRVLRPGGLLLITVPFVWDEHEQPYDFGRYSSFGLRYLVEQNGFAVRYLGKNGHYLTTLAQLLSAYIYTTTKAWPPLMRMMVQASLCLPIQLCGELAGRLGPRNADLYLDNILLATKRA